MPRRQRDYKAEYAATKRRVRASGYKSEREYRAVRKQLKLPPRTSPVPKRIQERIQPGITASATTSAGRIARLRRESHHWSDQHSHVKNSRYFKSFTDAQVERYWQAYVEYPVPGTNRKNRAQEKARRLKTFLYPDFLTLEEWEENYRL